VVQSEATRRKRLQLLVRQRTRQRKAAGAGAALVSSAQQAAVSGRMVRQWAVVKLAPEEHQLLGGQWLPL
jgi:hypothetical protein